jgi:hypothetical protein
MAMMWLLILLGLGWGIATLGKKAAANPEKTAAWAGIVHGLLKR